MIGLPGKWPCRYHWSAGTVFSADHPLARLELEDLVHQEERRAVRDDLLDHVLAERRRRQGTRDQRHSAPFRDGVLPMAAANRT